MRWIWILILMQDVNEPKITTFFLKKKKHFYAYHILLRKALCE